MSASLTRRILIIALFLGVAGNWLLRTDWARSGLTAFLLLVLGVAFAAANQRPDQDASAARERRWLFSAAAVLALLFGLRDASMLFALNFFATFVTGALIAWRARGTSLAALEPRDAVVGGAAVARSLLAAVPTMAVKESDLGGFDAERRKSISGFGIGAIAAAPVLLVVAALLGEADPLFAGILDTAASVLDLFAIEHLMGTLAAAWFAAAAVRGAYAPVSIGVTIPRIDVRLGFSTVAPLLGGLTLLLTLWIGLQLRTLFGGTDYVAVTAGVTVAEYARRGFFELIVIAGIALAALLASDEVLDRNPGPARNALRNVGSLLLVLVGAVLVSALMRFRLYLSYFGLTEDRVMALSILVWVALVLTWFGFTVLRGNRGRFAPGVLVISALWLGGLNVVNPERWIVETNLRRAERGLEFDAAYHAQLSGDAMPALLAGVHRLAPDQQAALNAEIEKVWTARAAEPGDWRGRSLPRVLAEWRIVR